MNPNDDNGLHEALRSLPLRKAPAGLLPGVLAAIQAEARLPWWQRGFGKWPLWAQFLLPASTAGITALSAYGFHFGAEGLADGAESAVSRLHASAGWIGTLASALGEAASGALAQLPVPALWAGAFLVATLAASALVAAASGTCLARLARSHFNS